MSVLGQIMVTAPVAQISNQNTATRVRKPPRMAEPTVSNDNSTKTVSARI
jgi:hypothetical protein